MTIVQLPTRFTIGGSEAAAAAGIDPHHSRVGLWLEKTGRVEREETEAMEWGKRLEDDIDGALTDRGWTVAPWDVELRDDDLPWLNGHPDGVCAFGEDDPDRLLERKTASQWAKREWNGQPPLAYVAQCQHYLHLTGLDRAL